VGRSGRVVSDHRRSNKGNFATHDSSVGRATIAERVSSRSARPRNSATHLGQEEACKPDIDEDAIVERLAENPSDEGVPAELSRFAGVRVRIGVELLLLSCEPKPSVGVKGFFREAERCT
jgi:hypothetical protein